MRNRPVIIACLAVVMLLPGAARAEDAEKSLKLGIYAYEHGDYAEAITSLTGVLSPLRLASEDDVAQARKYLGASLFFSGKRDDAAEEFKKLLLLFPDLKLDAFIFPPQLVLFFDEVRTSIKDQLEKARAQKLLKDAIQLPGRRVEVHSLYVNAIPFGAPQFQNGDRVKGWVLLGTEAALLAFNVAAYWTARSYAGPGGYYASEGDRSSASTWRTIQLTSIGLFGGAWVYGIADGLVYFKPEVVIWSQNR